METWLELLNVDEEDIVQQMNFVTVGDLGLVRKCILCQKRAPVMGYEIRDTSIPLEECPVTKYFLFCSRECALASLQDDLEEYEEKVRVFAGALEELRSMDTK